MSDYLSEYHTAIKRGEVVAGEELCTLLEKLERDKSNPRYTYDTTNAERRIAFLENVVRLTKAPFYGQPMRLMLWQKAYIEALYSFKFTQSGLNRFTKSLLLVARKNAKTEMCSALLFDELICGEAGSDIVCGSNDDTQSSILYDATNTMRTLADPHNQDTHKNQSYIKNLINNSRIYKMSQLTKNKEGRSIKAAVIDEIHEMKDNSIIKSIEQSQSLQHSPLLIEITSEGFTNDGALDDETNYARKVLHDEIEDEAAEQYLPWLCTQDSEQEVWQDPTSWQKSNPSLYTLKSPAYLKAQLAKARISKPDRVFVLCKDFNIKQNNASAWLTPEEYTNTATFELEAFRGAVCLGGVDLSETTDLTCAKVLLMKADDNTKYIHTRYFIPEAKLEKAPDTTAGAKYKDWAAAGYITITTGNDIDLTIVADWFADLYKIYELRPLIVGYDQRFAKSFLRRMDDYGFDCEMINQNAETMGNAVKLVEADLHSRALNYQDNPVDKWCLGNAAIRVNNQGQALITKPQDRAAYRVDGAVCFAILLEVFRRYRSDFLSVLN